MKSLRTARRRLAAALAGLSLASLPGAAAGADGWLPTGQGITAGISGIAVAAQGGAGTEVLVVHDNKRPGEQRVSRIRIPPGSAPRGEVLSWDGERLPVDLEALSAVPGADGEFVALESSGRGYHLLLGQDAVRVLREFTVPGVAPGDNYEGFALTVQAGRLVAVWAHRGQDQDPAVLHTAALDWSGLVFGPQRTAGVRVLYPLENVRHISDVHVSSSGRVTVTSASDAGDDGPFDSAIHDAGSVLTGFDGRPWPAVREEPVRLAVFPGHKIEALDCPPGAARGVLGTDDENAGGSLRLAEVCLP
ncbi:hypothetical protein [Streptomyces jumonjinensis]|uniref:hypothetical protein n=1 Tax=Streptomyces jumonjinensis TaxID=1945 RepID=UPI0037A14E99